MVQAINFGCFSYIRQRRHNRKKQHQNNLHRKLKPSLMKAANPHSSLLKRGVLMSVKHAPLGTKKKDKFSTAPESSVQFQLGSHQRAAAPSHRKKQSEHPLRLTTTICDLCKELSTHGDHSDVNRVESATWTLIACSL